MVVREDMLIVFAPESRKNGHRHAEWIASG